MAKRVAMIGAGLGGLVCAEALQQFGWEVQIFEKSRGVGGRMATRRVDGENEVGDAAFDHGAQYFTARDDTFRSAVQSWRSLGLCEVWNGRIEAYSHREAAPQDAAARMGSLHAGSKSSQGKPKQRWVATPTMTAIAKHLSANLPPIVHERVVSVESSAAWTVQTVNGDYGGFDILLSNAPAPQSAELLEDTPLAEACRQAKVAPCWALMAAFAAPLPTEYDGLFVNEHPTLAWLARNSSKPQRPSGECWVIHANSDWSVTHEWEASETVAATMWSAFAEVVQATTGSPPPPSAHLAAHRWRFALPTEPLEPRCLWDASWQLGACGDWCGGPRVEGAFLSGQALAAAVLGNAAQ